MKVKLFAAVALAALLGLVVPVPTPASDRPTISEALAGMKDHTVLHIAVAEAKEDATLKGAGPLTLFAPTDAAFRKLDDATIMKIATDKETVKQLLRAHLVKGKLLVDDLKALDGKEERTLGGTALKVRDAKDGLRVGEAKITDAPILCSNGVIHVIDVVLPVGK